MKKTILSFFLVLSIAGCTAMREKEDKVDPYNYMYPKKVKWDEPKEVLKAFYGAKKRGDWKKAFEICNFNETRNKQEIRRIKEDWKKDSAKWEVRYKFHDWHVSEKKEGKDSFVFFVTEFKSIPDPKKRSKMTDYEETMKLYGKKWKLVMPEVPGE